MIQRAKSRNRIEENIRQLQEYMAEQSPGIFPQLCKGKVQKQNICASHTVRKIRHGKKRSTYGSAEMYRIDSQDYDFRQGHYRKDQCAQQSFPEFQPAFPQAPYEEYKRNAVTE